MTPDWYTYPDIDSFLNRYLRGDDFHPEPCPPPTLREAQGAQPEPTAEDLLEEPCQTNSNSQ